jgi:pyruvate dehydrogenase E1 component alpha subunit
MSQLTYMQTEYISPENAAVNKSLSAGEKLTLYRDMVRIRRFEERAVRSYFQGKIGGFCHTYIGQEAIAVGSISVLGPNDHIITAYRDHGHALAVGMPMNPLMAEMYGKQTGCSKGKGGSMHFFDPKLNFWGGHGIVGAQTPLGLGIAFAIKYQNKKGACLCYLGDGAVNQGAFYESLNLASLWEIPVIYIIENNRYSMGTSQARSSAGTSLAERGRPFGVVFDTFDGNDLYLVRSKTAEALEYAYTQSKPVILEMDTYRYRGHSMSDPDQTYRTKEEIEYQKQHGDPITRFQSQLIHEQILTPEAIESMDEAIRAEVEQSVKFSEESPYPSVEDIQKDVFWELDHSESQAAKSTFFFNQI